MHSEKCPICKGKKVKKGSKKLQVPIEAGAENGDRIIFDREAE